MPFDEWAPNCCACCGDEPAVRPSIGTDFPFGIQLYRWRLLARVNIVGVHFQIPGCSMLTVFRVRNYGTLWLHFVPITCVYLRLLTSNHMGCHWRTVMCMGWGFSVTPRALVLVEPVNSKWETTLLPCRTGNWRGNCVPNYLIILSYTRCTKSIRSVCCFMTPTSLFDALFCPNIFPTFYIVLMRLAVIITSVHQFSFSCNCPLFSLSISASSKSLHHFLDWLRRDQAYCD